MFIDKLDSVVWEITFLKLLHFSETWDNRKHCTIQQHIRQTGQQVVRQSLLVFPEIITHNQTHMDIMRLEWVLRAMLI